MAEYHGDEGYGEEHQDHPRVVADERGPHGEAPSRQHDGGDRVHGCDVRRQVEPLPESPPRHYVDAQRDRPYDGQRVPDQILTADAEVTEGYDRSPREGDTDTQRNPPAHPLPDDEVANERHEDGVDVDEDHRTRHGGVA